jgi:hypothetical protein
MTAPTFALTATEYLKQADADVADASYKELADQSKPPAHRAATAHEVLVRYFTSRRRQRLYTAALAEQQ